MDLRATLNGNDAIKKADIVILATPTNYDAEKNCFDSTSLEINFEKITKLNSNALIVIKSTIPVGYTISVREKYKNQNIVFSPEFLRLIEQLADITPDTVFKPNYWAKRRYYWGYSPVGDDGDNNFWCYG